MRLTPRERTFRATGNKELHRARGHYPDPDTGIGRWTEDQFVATFKTGISPAGIKYRLSPMEWEIYSNMKEADLRAIYGYLRTVKPISNRVPQNIPPK